MDFSFSGVINFLLGILSGFILFSILYVYFIVRGKGMDFKSSKRSDEEVDEEALRALVTEKQKAFKKEKKSGKQVGKLTFDLSYELIEDIATYYFPKSKYPMLELSVDEMLVLNYYITQRVEKILDQPILKNTRNIRITKLVRMYETKKAIDEKKLVKAAKSKAVKTTMKYTLAAVNVMNPAYWFRKLVINKSVDFVSTKISLMILAVVGEETIKVYSKKLFDKDVDFDLVDKELKALEDGEDDE